jgi:hypothetical protein
MTSISEIQELARILNLQNIAKGVIDLSHDKESNLAYLRDVLQQEVSKREECAVLKREKAGRIPKKTFVASHINSGIAWQIERLEELEWIEREQNLILIGKCSTGKTSLAAHLGRKALEEGIKASYATFDDFLYTVERLYTFYKHSVPSERSESKSRQYFRTLPERELSDDDMLYGKRRDPAQIELELYILCQVLLGMEWNEERMGKWFWQSKEDKDLVILKQWIQPGNNPTNNK